MFYFWKALEMLVPLGSRMHATQLWVCPCQYAYRTDFCRHSLDCP